MLEQNGYDLWNQHPSISLKRIFWSLQFTKNRKFEICESEEEDGMCVFIRVYKNVECVIDILK